MFFKKPKFNRYGWKKSNPDFRDWKLSEKVTAPAILPPVVDLRSQCSPIKDQMSLGACTSHGLTSCIEFLELKDKHPLKLLSRLFLYYNERALEGTVKQDSGAQIRDGIKTLNKQGCCLEALWPYNISRYAQQPNSNCYNNAITHDLVNYYSINTLTDMKTCLSQGYPFVFGFSVYSSFESTIVAQTGIVPMPNQNEECLGGHCVYCCGYDDKKQVFICVNSWGQNWGDHGYFYMPYSYLTNKNLADDMWTLRKTVSE